MGGEPRIVEVSVADSIETFIFCLPKLYLIMNKSPQKVANFVSRSGLLLPVFLAATASSSAFAGPSGMYLGAAGGLAVNARQCGDFNINIDGNVCDRVSDGGKIFGGYYLSPGFGLEGSYLRFGSVNRRQATLSTTPTVGAVDSAELQDSARALALGVNLEVEIFQSFTNHLRVGWSWTRHDQVGSRTVVASTGPTTYTTTDIRTREYRAAPYFGAGMSGLLTRNLRVFSGWDFIIDGSRSNHLFSAGVAAEFNTNEARPDGVSRAYGGISLVRAQASGFCPGLTDCKDANAGLKATLGHRFSRHWGSELGMTLVRIGQGTSGSSRVDADGRVFSWAAVLRMPVYEGVSVLGKFGVGAVMTSGTGSVGSVALPETQWSVRPLAGVGVEAEVVKGLRLVSTLERTKYKVLDSQNNLNLVSLGAQADF